MPSAGLPNDKYGRAVTSSTDAGITTYTVSGFSVSFPETTELSVVYSAIEAMAPEAYSETVDSPVVEVSFQLQPSETKEIIELAYGIAWQGATAKVLMVQNSTLEANMCTMSIANNTGEVAYNSHSAETAVIDCPIDVTLVSDTVTFSITNNTAHVVDVKIKLEKIKTN